MRATFILHNGVTFDVDVASLTRTTNKVTNETTGFEWEHGRRGSEADRLFYIRVEQVDAVVVHRTDLESEE